MRRHRGRWLFLIVLLAGVLAFTGFWYLAAGDTRDGEPDTGGVYVEGMAGAPLRINPLFAAGNSVDQSLASLIFAGLTRLDAKGVAFPDLAETWTLSQDGTVYTFRLRPNLLWHDGKPLTAEDVVFTYELLRSQDAPSRPPAARVLEGATITQLDSLTVSIALPQPFAPLPAYLTLGILPAHLLAGSTASQLYESAFNQQPVGAGPYRLEQLGANAAVLAAHSAYHFNQPYIPRFEMRFFRDQGALLAALKAGELDGAFLQSPLGPTETFELERRRDLRLQALDTGHLTCVFLNLDLPLFEDRRLRQALLYSIDRDGIVSLLGGQAVRADSPVPPGNWAYSPSLTRYGVDANLAAILLDEAGWAKGADGVRRRGATALAFTLVTDSDPVRVEIAQRIAKSWGDIGARVTVQPAGLTTIVREIIEPRRHEAVLFSIDAAQPDPDPYPAWHSSQATARGGNLASFSSKAVDALLEEARGNVNHARRRELYAQFQELFAQEVPAIPLYVSTALYVQKNAVADVKAGLLTQPGDRFWQAHEWYIKGR